MMSLAFADENRSPLLQQQQPQAQPRREPRKPHTSKPQTGKPKPKLRRRQVLVQVVDSLLLVQGEQDENQVCQIPLDMFPGRQFQKQV